MLLNVEISNPYQGAYFFEFFVLFFSRLGSLLFGQLSIHQLASDEVQIFALIGLSISSALVGSFLVLKRMAMLANSLSHTMLIGIVLVYVLFRDQSSTLSTLPPFLLIGASMLIGGLTTFLSDFFHRSMKLQEEASVGFVFTTLFALGVVLTTVLTRNIHLGIEAVMGDIDAIHVDDLSIVYWVLLINLILVVIFFKEFEISAFDPSFAVAVGISPMFYHYLLMSQVSMTAISAFRVVGFILVLAMMTAPFLMGRLFFNRLRFLLWVSSGIGVACSLIGVALTRHVLSDFGVPLSTAAVMISLLFCFYLLAIGIKKFMT